MEPISGSILSAKGILAAIGLLIASISGYALIGDNQNQVDDTTNFLVQNTDTHNSFRSDILVRADEVNNTITNMLNGDVSIGKADKVIMYEKVFSRDQTGISPDDMKINNAYMDYLNAASAVIKAYTYEDPELQNKIDAMIEKKELI